MKSETGSLLTKISAIINFVIAGLVFFLGLISVIGLSFYQGVPFNLMFLILGFSIIVFVLGVLLWNAAEKMKNSKTVKN